MSKEMLMVIDAVSNEKGVDRDVGISGGQYFLVEAQIVVRMFLASIRQCPAAQDG